MKILCRYSGIEFQVQHFPFTLESRECAHPVFSIPQSKLLVLCARDFASGKFTPIDSYLAFLSLLHSTGKVDWRVPAVYLQGRTDSIIAANIESLIRTIGLVSAVDHPALVLPSFVISPDTKDLQTVQHWIAIWTECYKGFLDGNKKAQLHDRIIRREQAMERLIKDPSKNPANYAVHLSEWAALVGEFPTGTVPVDGKQISLAEYWKSMIRRAARGEAVFSLNDTDLAELIEHCEDSIPLHGGIYGHTLMSVLRDAFEKKKNFLGLGDFDIHRSTYRIISDDTSAEAANLMAMIDSAPATLPVESNYPSKIAFLRAMGKWRAAEEYREQTKSDNDKQDKQDKQDKSVGASASDNLEKL